MKYPLNAQPLCPVSPFLSGEMSTLVTLCNQRTAIHGYQSVKHLKCTALVSGLAWPNSKPVAVSTVIKVKLASSDSGRGPTKSTCHRVKGTLPSPPVHQWLPACSYFSPRNRKIPPSCNCLLGFCPCLMVGASVAKASPH